MEEREIRSHYQSLEKDYRRLADEVEKVLQEGLKAAEIDTSAIWARVKTIDSVLKKVKTKEYKNPFEDIEDFAAIRIVCHYTNQIDPIRQLIKTQFVVVKEEDKSALLGSDRMGYGGWHYEITLSERCRGNHYDGLESLRCEIQLRTICQDAWAQVSHRLDYKSDRALPAEQRRKLYRVAALMEGAQEAFDSISAVNRIYVESVKAISKSPAAFLLQPIDRETVAEYVKSKYEGKPVKHEIVELFIRDLEHDRYKTLGDIDEVVTKAKPFNDYFSQLRPDRYTSGIDFLTKGFGYVDLAFRAKHPFGRDTKKVLADFKPQPGGG